MTFAEKAASYVGQNVQVVTTVDTLAGVLLSVDETLLAIRTNGLGGYGEPKDITLLTDSVAYIRT